MITSSNAERIFKYDTFRFSVCAVLNQEFSLKIGSDIGLALAFCCDGWATSQSSRLVSFHLVIKDFRC